MHHDLNERAYRISEEIDFIKPSVIKQTDELLEQADLKWNLSYLLAQILLHAKPLSGYSFNEQGLQEAKVIFERSSSFVVDIDGLKSKYWLRNVLGKICIPSSIRYAIGVYDRIRYAEAELVFLTNTFNQDAKLSAEELSHAVVLYLQEKGIEVNIENATVAGFLYWREIEQSYSIGPLREYEQLLSMEKDFAFLSYLNSNIGGDFQFEIEASKYDELCQQHRAYYPAVDLQLILKSETIKRDGNRCLIQFQRNIDSNVFDKSYALLFQFMAEEDADLPTNRLVAQWLEKVSLLTESIHAPDFLSKTYRDMMLDGSMLLLLSEQDLVGTEQEYAKVMLDCLERRLDFLKINAPWINYSFSKENDIFSQYRQLVEKYGHNGGLPLGQSCRAMISSLIRIVVKYDYLRNPVRVYKLYEHALERPYLLYSLGCWIAWIQPSVIPLLSVNTSTASLSLVLYREFRQHNERVKASLLDTEVSIVAGLFQLLLDTFLRTPHASGEEGAQAIHQALFEVYGQYHWFLQANPTEANKTRLRYYEQLIKTFESILSTHIIGCIMYKNAVGIKELLTAVMTQELNESLSNRHLLKLPTIKMELLAFLLRLSDSHSMTILVSDLPGLKKNMVSEFFKSYAQILETQAVDGWDFTNNKEGKFIPVLGVNYAAFNRMPWAETFVTFNGLLLLDDWLDEVRLGIAGKLEGEKKHFLISKVQAFIHGLLLVHKALSTREYRSDIGRTGTIMKVEQALAKWIQKWSHDSVEHGGIDIFSSAYENNRFQYKQEYLLPKIAVTVNYMSDVVKNDIFRALFRKDSLSKALHMLEFITKSRDRQLLVDKIEQQDVLEYVSHKYSYEVEHVLSTLAVHEEFKQLAKSVLEYWVISEKADDLNASPEKKITAFRIRLLLAYFDGNINEIENIINPGFDRYYSSGYGQNFQPEETRNFYKGLLAAQRKEYEKAITVFNTLINDTRSIRPEFAVNRFHCRNEIAIKIRSQQDRLEAFENAIKEWDDYISKIPEGDMKEKFDFVSESIWFNKLLAFLETGNRQAFNRTYLELELSHRMLPAFLELYIKYLTRFSEYDKAKQLLIEALEYHRMEDGSVPDSIKALRHLVEEKEDFERMRFYYQDIVSRSPQTLIRILPEKLNGGATLEEFLLREICGAVNDLLGNINAIREIGKEDKYTDLVKMVLRARTRNWDWNIGGDRGGYSAPKSAKGREPNPGEIDLMISEANNDHMATIEALILNGTNRNLVLDHVMKTFNYDHRRKLFFILNYYQGKYFVDHWGDYKNYVSNISYPTEFPILNEALEDLSGPFTNHSVRVAIAKHDNGLIIYHLFINVGYKIES
ncbi:hypothetical protein [Chitinophaga sp. 212800010-3]|uniref:tetratricopeptide repeat protein n=1 Tax=unclassified Chitinophaga TaxID=2619133 RepID=UPI002DE27F79|nr:hypothetical protein [Chitinophaga sp. 212800010-3]